MKKQFVRFVKGVAAVGGVVMTGIAHAAIDVTAATTAIGDGTAAVIAVGGAALAVMGTAAAFKYVRRAF